VETIGSKRSYALIWCMPNNDDDMDELHLAESCLIVLKENFSMCFMLYSLVSVV